MNLLSTTEISLEIERIISEANEFIIIISPYLKINNRLKTKMSECFNRCKTSILVYRDDYLKKYELNWLKDHSGLKIFLVKTLHAKCYLNEKNAVITSMNLQDYSQINNHELGVKMNPKEDRENFIKLMKEIGLIINSEYSTFDFSEFIDRYLDFSMGHLAIELTTRYNFPYNDKELDGAYRYLCSLARKIHHFQDHELYQDKTAILRSTTLKKADYKKLFNEIAKFGKLK
jgi:phosphatidylserine/phosphatidylglycerophosphate/cardiolipin synthase-like enzyme